MRQQDEDAESEGPMHYSIGLKKGITMQANIYLSSSAPTSRKKLQCKLTYTCQVLHQHQGCCKIL